MAIAIEDDVRGILFPARVVKIRKAFTNAWSDWQESPERSKYSRWARTRANMVFERIAVRLLEEFASDGTVRFVFQDETIRVVFDDRLLIRCKKANERGLGENVPTQAALAFCEAQSDLPGLPGLQKVEILYHLSETETAIEGIVVQARDGDMRLWAYELGAASGGADVSRLPEPAQPRYDTHDLVRPRKPSDRDEESKD